MRDLVIIGAGPAGITASVYAARQGLDILVLTLDIGGQTVYSGGVENYTGYQFISGPDLAAKFEDHLRKFKVELKEGETALDIAASGGVVTVKTAKAAYEAKAAIIASGKKARELAVPGEKEFKNKGLTYCATCDGPLFAGKRVAVIGGGNSAVDAALQLVRVAGHVYLINNTPAIGGDKIMRDTVLAAPNVTVLNNRRIEAILGERMVKAVAVRGEGGPETVEVEGVFVEIGLEPNSGFARGVAKNAAGEIRVNPSNETNVAGIFAAGDVTDVVEKQIIIAAGEGAKAALSVFHYLSRRQSR